MHVAFVLLTDELQLDAARVEFAEDVAVGEKHADNLPKPGRSSIATTDGAAR